MPDAPPRHDRLPGWEMALARWLALDPRRPFVWGEWDCAQFAARAVEVITGRDVRPRWSYASRAEGVRRMRALGFRDHVGWFEALFPEVAPGAALPGDIAILRGRILGIVQGRHVYHVTQGGLALAPRSVMRGALAV